MTQMVMDGHGWSWMAIIVIYIQKKHERLEGIHACFILAKAK